MRMLLSLLCFAVLVGCSANAPATCQQAVQPYTQTMRPIIEAWTDAVRLAGSTPRASLSAQIATLQDTRRRANAVTPPECLQSTHARLLKSMDTTIQSFLDFLEQKPDATVQQGFVSAATDMQAYQSALTQIAQGTPVP